MADQENNEHVPIPQPPGLPFFGNIADMDPEFPLGSLMRMADTYGTIYRFVLAGQTRVVIGSQALMNEVCDESRFMKKVVAGLEEVRNGVHDGLFTAYGPQERNWGIAHRVLIPAFGPLSIRGMFDEMHDIASQLVLKWARHGPAYNIEVVDDFTRLTLDTLALCAMDYRFNSYYYQEMHPFIEAMGGFLVESGNRARRPAITQAFYRQAQAKYEADIALLQKTAYEVIKTRRANPVDKKDLLNAMIEGRDPKTGEGLSDQSIMDNMITFLIAGHETTSGLLSFAFFYLIKNPQAYQKAQEEIDKVIGTGPITVDHLSKLPYLNAVLRETLRLTPTAPAIAMAPLKDEVLGGKFHVQKDEAVVALLPKIHRDPVVYGEDADAWRPERMLDENFDRINKEFPNCWKPFGNGMRGCIGRPFAWQEALLVTAMLLQNFNFVAEDPSYQLKFKQTLTIKPKGFRMRATLRNGRSPTTLEQQLASTTITEPKDAGRRTTTSNGGAAAQGGVPLSVFYGSNTGTCEALARRLASNAGAHGFSVKTVDALDALKAAVPTDHPVAIVTASFEGQPPDNAGHFVSWLESLTGNEMEKVNYAVFGCGHHDWAQTFHRIPKHVDNLLEQRGGHRVAPLGTADAAAGDMFTDFERWEDEIFWPAMTAQYESQASAAAAGGAALDQFEVQVSSPRPSTLRQEVKEARVVAARTLTAPGVPEKRHIEIQLPSDTEYSVGDYLAVLPLNPKETVARVMRYFGLAWDSMLTVSAASPTTLPTDSPISAADLFGAYVELAQPASKRNVTTLAEATQDEATKKELTRLSGDDAAFSAEISAKRISVLDLLERFPAVTLPLNSFLQMVPPMRVRQYSVSSSPLKDPAHASLTYAVLDQPALGGAPGARHLGVASSYLSRLAVGDRLHVSVRPSSQAFRPPVDAENVPVVMVGAGSGLAPFRGFVQERAAQLAAGRALAPALLFFGCRDPEGDDLYADEFAAWEAAGAVEVRRAYSRRPDESKGCKYVQDRLYADRADVLALWDRGAKVFVCGSSEVGNAIREVSLRIAREKAEGEGRETTDERLETWFEGIRNDRYATDVFA